MKLPDVVVRSITAFGAVLRTSLSDATLSLFAHAPYPLEHTLDYRGDPGIVGPDSVSWPLIADVSAFVGGLRGLLIQAAHPEVVAGVDHHSRYRDDPLGRLSRTSAYVTATTFGAMPEVEHALKMVRRAHRVVSGISSRGIAYDASHPEHAAWVHNALTDSFLEANQVYGARVLTVAEADRFVSEQARIGRLLDADPTPETAAELRSWVNNHPAVSPSPETEAVVDFLTDPPLSPGIKVGYAVLLEAAIATLPMRIREVLGVRPKPGAEAVGRSAVAGLRWALGFSPSWALSLERTGEPIPKDMFRRLPESLDRAS